MEASKVLRTTLRSLQTTCKEFHQAVKDGDVGLPRGVRYEQCDMGRL